MASVDTGGEDVKKGPGVKKPKKLSTRVDMTPMVDLGFLLITFFIFTSTMSEPKALNLNMPKKSDNEKVQMEVSKHGMLTILLGKDKNIFYYDAELQPDGSNFVQTNYEDIRQVIIDKKKSVMAAYVEDPKCIEDAMTKQEKSMEEAKRSCMQKDFFVIIKPTGEATYKDAVDILDEMAINEVERYAIITITDTEKKLVEAMQK